jgi:hypothetical protein
MADILPVWTNPHRSGEPVAVAGRAVGRDVGDEGVHHRCRDRDGAVLLRLAPRLVPGGQLPVLVVAALGGYPSRRYAVVASGAATLGRFCTRLAAWLIEPPYPNLGGHCGRNRPGAADQSGKQRLKSTTTPTGTYRLQQMPTPDCSS